LDILVLVCFQSAFFWPNRPSYAACKGPFEKRIKTNEGSLYKRALSTYLIPSHTAVVEQCILECLVVKTTLPAVLYALLRKLYIKL